MLVCPRRSKVPVCPRRFKCLSVKQKNYVLICLKFILLINFRLSGLLTVFRLWQVKYVV